jgi:hypothetical protein
LTITLGLWMICPGDAGCVMSCSRQLDPATFP